jgi:hypothetical protein
MHKPIATDPASRLQRLPKPSVTGKKRNKMKAVTLCPACHALRVTFPLEQDIPLPPLPPSPPRGEISSLSVTSVASVTMLIIQGLTVSHFVTLATLATEAPRGGSCAGGGGVGGTAPNSKEPMNAEHQLSFRNWLINAVDACTRAERRAEEPRCKRRQNGLSK